MADQQRPSDAPRPQVSVIIPAHNAERVLDRCLESVFASEGVRFEVILVDDASTDGTLEIARRFPCRIVALRDNIMSANARNLAARHARGDLLVFFDADELMAPDTLARFATTLARNPDHAAVVGSLAADTPEPGFFSRFKNFQHHFTHQTACAEGATLDSGRMAIRRQAFADLGGFEPAFSGASIEDIALGYRMTRAGYRIRFDPTIQVVHLKSYTLGEMVRSDIFHRAIPWTGLMLRERIFRSDLNTSSNNVASVVLAWLLPACLVGGVFWRPALPGVALLVAMIALLNREFLLAAYHRFGVGFALCAAAFLPAMYFYQGVGLIAGVIAYGLGGSVAQERAEPSAQYDLLEPEER